MSDSCPYLLEHVCGKFFYCLTPWYIANINNIAGKLHHCTNMCVPSTIYLFYIFRLSFIYHLWNHQQWIIILMSSVLTWYVQNRLFLLANNCCTFCHCCLPQRLGLEAWPTEYLYGAVFRQELNSVLWQLNSLGEYNGIASIPFLLPVHFVVLMLVWWKEWKTISLTVVSQYWNSCGNDVVCCV